MLLVTKQENYVHQMGCMGKLASQLRELVKIGERVKGEPVKKRARKSTQKAHLQQYFVTRLPLCYKKANDINRKGSKVICQKG